MLYEKKVRDSFRQAKADNEFLQQWVMYLKERIDDISLLSTRINNVERDIEELKNKFTESLMKNNEEKQIVHQQFNEEKKEILLPVSLDGLTDQQKKTFFIIGSLQREHGAHYVPVRMINTELYGVASIEKMQSTVANYLKRLEELHFIERTKKGRNSYVKLSELGMKAIASHHVEQMKIREICQQV